MPRHGLPLLKDRQKNKSFNNSIRDVCENPQLVELLSWAEEGENFAQALWGRSSLYQNQIDKRCGTQPQLIFIINHGRPCLFVRFGHLILVPVMPRRGSYFFLLVQAKVTKKKDTPLTAPSKERWGYPALLAMPGGCGIRSFVPVWAQKVGVPLWENHASRSDCPRRHPPA